MNQDMTRHYGADDAAFDIANELQGIVDTIDLLELPDPLTNASEIIYPTVPAGYSIAIASSSDESIVDLNGHITRENTTKVVRLKFTVTQADTGARSDTRSLLLPVYKKYTALSVTAEEIAEAKKDYEALKYGIFVHYVPSTKFADNTEFVDMDTLADNFDAEQFAKDMHDFGTQYVVFTAWHWNTTPLFPSITNQRWRDERTEVTFKTYSERDVIADLLDALEPYGIQLHLYVHPSEGKDFFENEKLLTGWEDSNNNYETWNKYTRELMYEMGDRYGDRIAGIWIDAFFVHVPQAQQPSFKQYTTAYNPKMIIQFNVGLPESEHIENPLSEHTTGADTYRCWEFRHTENLEAIPLTRNQTAIVVGEQWYTEVGKDTDITINSPEEIFRYTVGQASISTAGGFLASAGCYPNRSTDDLNGNIWEKGMRNTFLTVNTYLTNLKDTIFGTLPGKAYPTVAGKKLNELTYVTTESSDEKYVYVHVLNPDGASLTLPAPSDGSIFSLNSILRYSDGSQTNVKLNFGNGKYIIEIPDDACFDTVDTVIVLERTDSAINNSQAQA